VPELAGRLVLARLFVGYGALADGESLEDVMTLDEAKPEHMAAAIAEAKATEKRWRESRPPVEDRPEPTPPLDPATQKWVSDDYW
jgi:hypothetical protein